jgi:hypothetical protein
MDCIVAIRLFPPFPLQGKFRCDPAESCRIAPHESLALVDALNL